VNNLPAINIKTKQYTLYLASVLAFESQVVF
jgi:hypothetical protein